jgi:hypothetical protein
MEGKDHIPDSPEARIKTGARTITGSYTTAIHRMLTTGT